MSEAGSSWGRYPQLRQRVLAPAHPDAPIDAGDARWLPYGNGRSYGDSCLNAGGALVHTRWFDNLLGFDPDTGLLRCESGVRLGELLDLMVPRGWCLPVVPGTRHVTVGGAIANDVHGKNHHRAGSFGEHVLGFELRRGDGQRVWCSADQDAALFRATIGGLGLTGLVTRVALRLRRVAGPWLDTRTERFDRLADFFALSQAAAAGNEYTVAWIDAGARGTALGRGVFSSANHAADAGVAAARPRRPLRMPFTPPFSLVNRASARALDGLRWHRARHRESRVRYDAFFHPLDRVADWNRAYGPRGFLQYQCVLPPAKAPDAIGALLARIQAADAGAFLAVLKQFGDRPPAGLLSFARAGTTLAVDFPIDRAGRVFALLDALDAIVAEAGGALYPAKDARMGAAQFRRAFPAWEEFRGFVDPQLSSGFWRRVSQA